MIAKANEINPQASKSELDMLLSTGEQISIALCAMAMEKRGLPVVSLTAWQVGIQTNNTYTDARIRKFPRSAFKRNWTREILLSWQVFRGSIPLAM